MEISKYFSKVYLWMCIGLAITFITGECIANSPNMTSEVFSGWYYLIVLLEIGTVVFLSARISRMSAVAAKIAFILYSFLTGLTFSSIFIVYKAESIMIVFLITSVITLILSLIGYFTNADLTKLGTLLFVGLIVIIVLALINMFIGNANLNMGICVLSILIFIGYIAYDTHVIKKLYYENPNNENLVIMGALQLYLDFINIFIDLLRLFGKEK